MTCSRSVAHEASAQRWILLPIGLLIAASASCASVLTGNNLTRQIDGRIDDSDTSTNQAGTYTSQGVQAGWTDGLSQAKSAAPSHKRLEGTVHVQITAGSKGPFAGTPSGVSNQKVRSTFSLDTPTRLLFDLEPRLSVYINSTGRATVHVAAWVLDATGTAVPGSIVTAKYSFEEDPADSAVIRITITRSDGSTASDTMFDYENLSDTGLTPRAFTAGPGRFTAQFELNIEAGGDTDLTYVIGTGNFDLTRAR